jgi:putative acetyltransferase
VDLTTLHIREERAGDEARVAELVEAAFGQPEEARLVEALRRDADPTLSLVAEVEGRIAGHIFFSPVAIECAGAPPCGGLAPVAVDPERQGLGIGSALVRAGLVRCPDLGWRAVFLLGNPAYYGRFGFELAAPTLRYESEAFDSAFQKIELEPGVLSGLHGFVRYHPAFGDL